MEPVIQSIPSEKAKICLDYLLQAIFDANNEDELRENLKIFKKEYDFDDYDLSNFFIHFGAHHCAIHEKNGSGKVMKERLLFIEF